MKNEESPGGQPAGVLRFHPWERLNGSISAALLRGSATPTISRLAPPAALGGTALALSLALTLLSLFALEFDAGQVKQLLTLALAFAGWSTAAVLWFIIERQRGELKAARMDAAASSRRSLAAETANSAKSRYLANASHEIRSPLNAIYGYAQLMERNSSGDVCEAARVIRRSAEHLTSLVEGLLDISLLENGVMRIRSEQVNLREFIDQTCWMIRPDATAKGLEFCLEMPTRLPELVRTDQGRLRQIVLNLLSNAIKFTDHGSVTLKVRYSNQIATFEVIDTGPGIPDADRERIFIPFERGTAEDQQRRPGVGLGLPITKAIVEILGGQIEVENRHEAGTCFRVTMMLGEVANSATGHTPAHRQLSELTPLVALNGKGRSILVVDDDAQQLSLMRTLLSSQGFAVSALPDGESAIDLCRRVPFDLVVLDINLPGISGWETGDRIRGSLGQDVRILVLSGNALDKPVPGDGKPMHDLFLAKPAELNTLLEAVGTLLGLTGVRSGPVKARVPAGASLRMLPHIRRIRGFLSIGHYRGVESSIRELAEDVPEAGDLVAFLLDSLDRFDLSAMSRKLECY